MKTCHEFIDEMSKSEKREFKNRLYVVLEHVLKLKYVKGQIATDNARVWKNSAQRERSALADLLREHPALKPELTYQLIDEVYRMAVANVQVVYANERFPRTRQLSVEEIVGKDVMMALQQ